jgi:hypothetical protein
MEISWTDRVKKEPRKKEHPTHTRTHTHTHTYTHRQRRKASSIGDILPRNSFLKHVIEGNMIMMIAKNLSLRFYVQN